jgi:hypothetical protein
MALAAVTGTGGMLGGGADWELQPIDSRDNTPRKERGGTTLQ